MTIGYLDEKNVFKLYDLLKATNFGNIINRSTASDDSQNVACSADQMDI